MDIKLNDFKKLKGKFRNFKIFNIRLALPETLRDFLKDKFKMNLDMRIIDSPMQSKAGQVCLETAL